MAVQTVTKMKSTRRMSLDMTELKDVLSRVGAVGYILDEALLREQVRYIPRFRGTYRQQCTSLVVKKPTSMPVFSTREGILIGYFTDVAPWDNQRHKWEVRLNGSYVTGLSLYQFWVQVVK
jgi:hypothetical protein